MAALEFGRSLDENISRMRACGRHGFRRLEQVFTRDLCHTCGCGGKSPGVSPAGWVRCDLASEDTHRSSSLVI